MPVAPNQSFDAWKALQIFSTDSGGKLFSEKGKVLNQNESDFSLSTFFSLYPLASSASQVTVGKPFAVSGGQAVC